MDCLKIILCQKVKQDIDLKFRQGIDITHADLCTFLDPKHYVIF